MEIPNIYATYLSLGLKPRSQMPLPTATDAGRTIFKQWKFGKTMEKRGDSYEIIVRTNLFDRSVTYILTHLESELRDYINRILVTTAMQIYKLMRDKIRFYFFTLMPFFSLLFH